MSHQIMILIKSIIVLLDDIVNQVESHELCNVWAIRGERLENLFTNVCFQAHHRLKKCFVFLKLENINVA